MIELPQNLIDALRAGDENGYRRLYELCYEPIYVLSYSILQNDTDAQDAVQRTFIQVFRKLSTLKNDAGFVKWMLKIAKNEALMILRSSRPAELYDEECDSQFDSGQDELMLPEVALERRDTADRLRGMIARLPYEQRLTLTLHYDQGLKVSEIAQIMDCGESTVKSRLRYARLKIRKEWEKQERSEQKKFNGVMLPFGEVYIRLLRRTPRKKRRKAALWKQLKAFLRYGDTPEYAAVLRAENAHALRVAAGIAAGFVVVMFASATLIDAAADGEEVSAAYGAGDQAEWEKEKNPNARETVYIPPQDIVEQRIADMPNGTVDEVVYYYEMDALPEIDGGVSYPTENGQTAATEPSTEPATEPPTEPVTEPPTEPTEEPTEPPTEAPTLSPREQILSEMSGRYQMYPETRIVEVGANSISMTDTNIGQTEGPLRIASVEEEDGLYRFRLVQPFGYGDIYEILSGYMIPKGTAASKLPAEVEERMRFYGYRNYGVTYTDGAYRLQKDGIVFEVSYDWEEDGYWYAARLD